MILAERPALRAAPPSASRRGLAERRDHLEATFCAGTHLCSIDAHIDSRGHARSGRCLFAISRVDRPT